MLDGSGASPLMSVTFTPVYIEGDTATTFAPAIGRPAESLTCTTSRFAQLSDTKSVRTRGRWKSRMTIFYRSSTDMITRVALCHPEYMIESQANFSFDLPPISAIISAVTQANQIGRDMITP